MSETKPVWSQTVGKVPPTAENRRPVVRSQSGLQRKRYQILCGVVPP
jgi:hypothetical protein